MFLWWSYVVREVLLVVLGVCVVSEVVVIGVFSGSVGSGSCTKCFLGSSRSF